MFVVILIRIKMGCGVICGDNAAIEATSQYNNAQHSLSILIPSLTKTSALVHKQSYQSFVQQYRLNPKKFHLIAPRHLSKRESVSEQVLIKWKLILYGLDGDNKKYGKCLGLPELAQHDIQIDLNVQQELSQVKTSIIYHECFVQIEKDLERTFALPQGRKRDFENVLKRIANFFPKMGYTQGINFVIGFLIIIGYSQNDSFWIFVHIALNKRYLLLGLYEDDFPLSNAFIYIFKNVLRRTDEALYVHLFDVLCVDTSIWIFKWFTTCFIYTFPFELIKYAWEIIIQLGSIGIVTFAIGLTRQLAPFLIQKEDMADVSQFLQSLKSLQEMNRYINMQRVMKAAFQIEILQSDFDGVEGCAGFYGKYLKESCFDLQKHLIKNNQALPKFTQVNKKSQDMLNQWYDTLLSERQAFQLANRTNNTKNISLLVDSNEKSQKIKEVIDDMVFYNYQQESTAPEIGKIRRGSMQLSRAASIFRNQKYCCEKINEKMEQQSRSQKSQAEIKRSSKHSKKGQIVNVSRELDELDKLGGELKNIVKQNVKINNFAAPIQNVTLHRKNAQSSNFQQNKQSGKYKTKRIPLPQREPAKKMGTFALAAQNMIKVDNYDASSVSSKHVSNRSHGKNSKGKGEASSQIRSGRSCACKIKTQENKLSNFDRSSELASSKDQFSDKQSIYNQNRSHNEDPLGDLQSITMERMQSNRERIQTFTDYMINSHGPILKEKLERFVIDEPNKKNVDGEIEVEVLPFKKDKKMTKGKVSHIEICKRQTPKIFRRQGFQHEEESLQSIRPCSFQKGSQTVCQRESHNCQGEFCDVESVR